MTDETRAPGQGDLTPPATAPVVATPTPDAAPGAAAPSADTVATAKPATLAGGAETDRTTPVPADWPEDWRDRLAGADAKFRKRLDRFNSPNDVSKSFLELEKKLSSGQTRTELPENPTDEQLAAYRKENGIPDDGKYDTDLGGGFVWADQDKAVLDDFAKHAHASNMPQAEFKKALAWYAGHQQQQLDAAAERDAQFRVESEDALRREYGPEFRRNMNAIGSLFSALPDTARENLFLARMPDGRIVGDHPEMVKFWANIARELNPAATLVPGSGADPLKSIDGRKAELGAMMADRNSPYWKGQKSAELQEEYRNLITAEQKLKSRGAA